MCAAPVHVDGKRGRAEVAVAIRAWEEAWAAAHVGPPGPGAEVLEQRAQYAFFAKRLEKLLQLSGREVV